MNVKFDFWVNFSFLLTIFKILAAVWSIYYIFTGIYILSAILIIIVIIFDIADGRVILLSKEVNERILLTRRIIDSVSDRVIIQSILLSVYLAGLLPIWLYLIFIIREVFSIIIASKVFLKYKELINISMSSRIATALMGLIVINILISNPVPNYLLFVPFYVFAFLGLISYYKIS